MWSSIGWFLIPLSTVGSQFRYSFINSVENSAKMVRHAYDEKEEEINTESPFATASMNVFQIDSS